ncbi:MAG TPA: M48 family metallopeptidase [Chitinophagales bacterium]|nr:M48 family metallopeptidase [Chitinophagales bacterium]HRK28619.1 M48 family metallopeptidase [Chitinophagales bacterium]
MKPTALLVALLLLLYPFITKAQCNSDDTIESWYSWAKDWENYAIDQFPISVSDEAFIGDTLHNGMAKEQKIVKNYPKQAYLYGIVQKLTKHINRKGIQYTIHVLDDPQTLNAFSIAGGHIYITSKMIEWTESEDELAFIIAHEIAHIDNRHAARKVQKMVMSRSVFEPYGYGDIAANLSLLLSAPFGQIDEYDADRSGAAIAAKAGYNPRKGLRFFQKMEENESYDMLEKVIRTHPYSHERLNCLDAYIKNELGM